MVAVAPLMVALEEDIVLPAAHAGYNAGASYTPGALYMPSDGLVRMCK